MFGLPYRVFVSVMGGVVTMLSITGIIIWVRKRQGRQQTALRRATLSKTRLAPTQDSRQSVSAEQNPEVS
jgi:hypothetical protein